MSEIKDNLLQLDKVVGDLNKRLDENIDKIDKLAVVYNKFSKESSTAPSQYVNVLNDTKKAVDNVTISAKKLEQQSIKESNARNALNKQREQSIAQLAKEQAKLEASSNLYNKIQAKMNALSNEYKNLATRKELGISLTDKEAKRYEFLQGKIQTYDKTLKAVDGTMGKYSRNVGNYAGAFNPLNNSINQLSREMPAFANSVQTGFMAISNNLPIFFDAMGGIIAQNKELQKQGKPTKSVFSQLAGAVFSMGTALSVGVTLLTVYGKDIVEFLGNTSKAQENYKKNMQDVNATHTETATKLQIVKEVMNDVTSTEKQRNAALKIAEEQGISLNAIEEARNGNMSLLNAELAANIDLSIKKAKADKLLQLISEQDIENQKNASAFAKSQSGFLKSGLRGSGAIGNFILSFVDEKEIKNVKDGKKAVDDYTEQYKKLMSELGTNITTTTKVTKGVKDHTKAVKENKKAEEEQLKFGTTKWLDAQIANLKNLKDTTATTAEQSKEINNAIKYYERWKDSIDGVNEKSKELNETQDEWSIAIPELDVDIFDKIVKDKEELDNWLKDFKNGFKEDFVSNSGFSKLFSLFENFDKLKTDGVATALAISEAFQQAFNTIANASQANFDAEYSRLEQQKTVSMQFAGESTAAKEEIEKEYERRKKEIQRREAEAQKRLAIFNIGINTAQAIAATFSKAGFPAGIPMAALMAAIGAAQIAMVSAQQIPQFWKGTDNAPEGLAWTQEKGAEVITDSKGNVKTFGNNKGAQLTYLNKGDKVYKSHTDYINKELSKNGIQQMGQSFSNVNVTSGLTAEDLHAGIESLKRTISSKENISIQIDKSGFKTAINGKQYLNNRLILKGRSV
jgi:DNA repair exonuclease SbcCD ATPase subunit